MNKAKAYLPTIAIVLLALYLYGNTTTLDFLKPKTEDKTSK